jgi:RNA polymerase sigma-70 factor (ECF subfamily)
MGAARVHGMTAFATTRWSLILASRQDSDAARDALAELCRIYRAPVLAFVRRRGLPPDRAEDLTQEFFAYFLGERIQHTADPARGRFRSYLLGAVRRFMCDARAAEHAARRGGEVVHLPLDGRETQPGDESPERAFERSWALTVLERAHAGLRRELEASGKTALYDAVREFLFETPEADDYRAVAARLGLRRNTLAVAVHRMRERLRELIRLELSDTVAHGAEVDAEYDALRGALGGTSARGRT